MTKPKPVDLDMLTAVADEIDENEDAHEKLLARRDDMIRRGLKQGLRAVDIAEAVRTTRAWVYKLRDK